MKRRSAVAAPSLLVGSVYGVLHTKVELLSLISDLPWHQPEGKRLKVWCPDYRGSHRSIQSAASNAKRTDDYGYSYGFIILKRWFQEGQKYTMQNTCKMIED